MNLKTRKAVNGSIKKWEGIRDGKVIDQGHLNCSLCQLFIQDFCSGCPVAEEARDISCDGTPYQDWCDAGGVGKTANTPKLKRLATAELNFLKSLLPKKGKKG